jgi:hypothetical protein
MAPIRQQAGKTTTLGFGKTGNGKRANERDRLAR